MTSTVETELLTADERDELLRWARRCLERYVVDEEVVPLPEEGVSPALLRLAGAFVTLHLGEGLRGCIGTFEGDKPLLETVRDMAIAASSRDPRFPRVARGELSLLHLEISVLSPRRQVERPLEELVIGRHGIYISKGWYRGVLLPQVATQYGWDEETFLRQTCAKAGLELEAWKDPETCVELFSAMVFGEERR